MVSLQQKPKFLKPDDNYFASEKDAQATDDQVTTFVFSAHHSLSIEAQRERLPIRKFRDHILYCLENYQTLILVGETGSGKSTQVPQGITSLGSLFAKAKDSTNTTGASSSIAPYMADMDQIFDDKPIFSNMHTIHHGSS